MDDDVLRVEGVDFVARTTNRFTSTPTRFCLVKRRDLVDRYLRLLDELEPRTIVELGVFQGAASPSPPSLPTLRRSWPSS